MTDIYGANLYNRYLAKDHADMMSSTKLVAQGTGSQMMMTEEEPAFAAQCRSILVGRAPVPRQISATRKLKVLTGLGNK